MPTDIAELTGYSRETIHLLRTQGWSDETIIATADPNPPPSIHQPAQSPIPQPKPTHQPTTSYTIDGTKYTVAQLSRKYGIKVGTLQARLHKHKWPLEKAISTPPTGYTLYQWNGKSHTIRQLCKIHNLPYSCLYYRLNIIKMPLEQALTTPTQKPPLQLTINGQTHTLKEWADISGTKKPTIVARLRAGRSPESAVFG